MANLVSQFRSGGGSSWGEGQGGSWADRMGRSQTYTGGNPVGAPGSPTSGGFTPPGLNVPNRDLGKGLGASAGQAYAQNPGYWDREMVVNEPLLAGVRGLVNSQYAPKYAQYNDQLASYDRALALSDAQYNQMKKFSGRDLWYDAANNQLNLNGINIQRNNIPLRRDFLRREFGLDKEMYDQDLNWLKYQDQTFRDDRGFDERDFANQRLGVQQSLNTNVRNLYDTSGAAGNMGGGSTVNQRTDYQDAANRDFADIQIADDRSRAGLDRSLAGNDQKRFELRNSLARKLLGFAEGNLDLDERKALLDIEAEQAGISRKQLINNYEREMAQMGFNRMMKVEEYAELKAKARLGISSTQQQEAADILSMSQAFGGVYSNPVWRTG